VANKVCLEALSEALPCSIAEVDCECNLTAEVDCPESSRTLEEYQLSANGTSPPHAPMQKSLMHEEQQCGWLENQNQHLQSLTKASPNSR
jgi:hypothetical protein